VGKRKKNSATRFSCVSDEKESYQQGLRALARLVARAYLCDMRINRARKVVSKGTLEL